MTTIQLDKFPGRQFTHDDKEYLYFGGTAYLGMQTHSEFLNLLIKNIGKYGSNYGSSRLSNVSIDVYEEAEEKLSRWVGAEAAITLSSGYLSGQLIANYFTSDQFRLFYGPNTHSALLLKGQKPFQDFKSLAFSLSEHLKNNPNSIPVILIDTIDLPVSNYPEFEELKKLPISRCILVADDSHGIGLVGPKGRGSYQALSALKPKELILCSSLGKAIGIPAGMVVGNIQTISKLKETSLFAGASPPPAAYLATLIEAFPIYEAQLMRLLELIDYFIESLKRPESFNYLENYPVFVYADRELGEFLFKNGICTTNFNYPAEQNSWQSRIVLSAAHKKEDIRKLAKTLNKFDH